MWRRSSLTAALGIAGIATIVAACSDETAPTPGATTVTIAYLASTSPRTDLPASVQACVQGSSPTHIHPSWRGFNTFPLQAFGANRWQIEFADVPRDVAVSFRINDPNACDQNVTGAVTSRNVFANDVLMTTMVNTPGSGLEPGFAFTFTSVGQIRP
jgi:hypothetical protein